MSHDPQPWARRAPFKQQDYGVFTTTCYRAVSPRTGREDVYVTINAPDWINVVALTDDGAMVLVRQYRHGVNEVTLEIPAGIVEEHEEPLAAAQRELAEETGYTSAQWHYLGSVHPNPAYMSNRCHSFLALQCAKTAVPALDPGEDIAIRLAPLPEVERLVRAGDISHALALVALLRVLQVSTPEAGLLRLPDR